MQFELDITKRLRSGGEEFLLRSRFATTDKSLVLFGPSGSGKTLTLQAVAGMLSPDEGVIRIGGETVFDSAAGVDVAARNRHVGYLFQDYALFPHLTVQENIGFGLKPLFGGLRREDTERVEELVASFGLSRLADKKPGQLSGGQQQRTALARALATSPRLLLLDEPFSALDQPLREKMRRELTRTLERFDIPMIMVTHDAEDVAAFAQSVVVYRNGAVEDVHSAREIAESGRNLCDALCRQVARAYS